MKKEFNIAEICQICGIKLTSDSKVIHHLSYNGNETIIVCRSCHAKIHHSNKYPDLKPVDKSSVQTKTCLRRCRICGNSYAVLLNTPWQYNYRCPNCRQIATDGLNEYIKDARRR